MDPTDTRIGRRSILSGMAGLGAAALTGVPSAKAAVGPKDKIKITKVETFLVRPRWLFLKIHTDAGIVGLGEPITEGRAKTCATAVAELAPYLVGKDPRAVVHHWQAMYRHAFYRGGPILTSALSGVDQALWDIKAKALGVPLYKLLGGSSREKMLVYCHASGRDMDAALEAVAEKREMGYRAIRIQSGVPGMEGIYGVPPQKKGYEPAHRGATPHEESWDTSKYLNYVPTLFAKARDVFGADLHLLHDSHHRLTPNEAARLGQELEPYHLFWLEDVVPAELQESLRLVRQKTTTPLAIGEIFNTVYDCQAMIVEQLIDYLRMTVSHGGGITPVMKIAAFAAIYHVKIGMHGPSDVSPVALGACLQVSRAINNFGIQEQTIFNQAAHDVFGGCPEIRDGYMWCNEKPGLGIDCNEELAAKFPFTDTAPFDMFWGDVRKRDGTVIRP